MPTTDPVQKERLHRLRTKYLEPSIVLGFHNFYSATACFLGKLSYYIKFSKRICFRNFNYRNAPSVSLM